MQKLELKIPPLVVGVIIAMLIWLISWALPGYAFAFPLQQGVAAGFWLAGVVITGLAVMSFGRAKTTVNPMKPESTASLVQSGIYRFTRNPMYLGFFLALVGLAVFLGNALAVLLLPVFIFYMNRFQIEPEERALTALFEREYVAYSSRVHRWL
jgi:protein-S-isoprenylcysteine O-methyltransferase Ste14